MQTRPYYDQRYDRGYDQLADQLRASRNLVLGVFIAILVALVLMRLMPEDATPLTGKVMVLLSPTLAAASIGAYVGQRPVRYSRGWRKRSGGRIAIGLGICQRNDPGASGGLRDCRARTGHSARGAGRNNSRHGRDWIYRAYYSH